jgi:phosphatidate cytidylyltransferase
MLILLPRFITALIGVPLILFLTYLGGLPFFLLICGIIFLCLWEYYTLFEERGYKVNKWFNIILCMLLASTAYVGELQVLSSAARFSVLPSVIFSFILLGNIVVAMLSAANRTIEQSYLQLLINVWGVVYICFLLLHIVSVRNLMPYGRNLTFLLFITTWIADTVAYAVGEKYGKFRITPYISPKKSLEGGIGCIIAVFLVVLVFKYFVLKFITWVDYCVISVILCFGIIFGDLGESFLKRYLGVKDTSPLLPGHGGVLDRFDNYTFSAPLLYYYIKLVLTPVK